MSKKQLFTVVGPTAVGKTAFALKLAQFVLVEKKAVGVDIISADSRQVYSALPILSGADIPPQFREIRRGEYADENIALHGVNMLDYNEDWSVSHFVQYAQKIITSSWSAQRMPIVVGGTGLYHSQLLTGAVDAFAPPDLALRAELEGASVFDLQARAQLSAQSFYEKLNHSDKHNPRRLIRCIEKAAFFRDVSRSDSNTNSLENQAVVTTFGLNASLPELEARISQRVRDRLNQGVIEEVRLLLSSADLHTELPIYSTLGLTDIERYLQSKITVEQLIELWSLHEYQYAKRQLTWWKKTPNIHWTTHAVVENPQLAKTLLDASL